MPLTYQKAIQGELVIIGKEPDGDSLRFRADDPANFDDLYRGWRIKPADDGSVQLRLEGIDAPETHYGKAAQPRGDDARDHLLDLCGFANPKFFGNKVTDATPNTIPAIILTEAAETHGRPISYLLVGAAMAGLNDGQATAVDADLLRKTINYQLLELGTAYPLLYTSMPAAHRAVFRMAAANARSHTRGVWADDRSGAFVLRTQEDISPGPEGQLIFPKLFRRATDFLKEVGESAVGADLRDWLEAHGGENDLTLFHGAEIPFSTLIAHENATVRLQADLLDLVFVEK
ncbi:MAG: thermonuclease family protein [Myxococcota bacterium]